MRTRKVDWKIHYAFKLCYINVANGTDWWVVWCILIVLLVRLNEHIKHNLKADELISFTLFISVQQNINLIKKGYIVSELVCGVKVLDSYFIPT